MKFLLLLALLFFVDRAHSKCGDSECNPFESETHVTCPRDCFCGDEVCDYAEHYVSCPSDCSVTCGDLRCSEGESSFTCPIDCVEELSSCFDGVCNIGETVANCPRDCQVQNGIEGVPYALFVSSDSLDFFFTCNISVLNENGAFVDEYEMSVVASGKTVPTPGLYFFAADCDHGASGFEWISIERTNPVSVYNFTVQLCGDGLCVEPETFESCPEDCCQPQCSGKQCGGDGCGGSCGNCSQNFECVNGVCKSFECTCEGRRCGSPPGCNLLCGLCDFDQFCDVDGQCVQSWSTSFFITAQPSECPDGTENNCRSGNNALFDIMSSVQPGDDVIVSAGHYCGGFTISVEGVRLTGEPGAVIVPCSSQWWDPAPPNCQTIDGASGTPCSLSNSLITVNASSVVITGFTFDGRVPNALFSGTPGVQVYSRDGTAIGAGRAIANWAAGRSRSFTTFPVFTLSIKNNTFMYFEEAGIRLKVATASIKSNSFRQIGTIGADLTIGMRQGKTEKTRGSRKDKPGASVCLDDSSGDVEENDSKECDYGGMSGGDYPPSSFPFKKRSISSRDTGRQYDYQLTRWSKNTFSSLEFGGVIVESMSISTQMVSGNVITGSGSGEASGRGLIIENITASNSLELSSNSIQGLEIGAWTWSTSGISISSENYQSVQTGVQLVGCNPFETNQPQGSVSLSATESMIDRAETAFWVQDEPGNNPLCSASQPIFLSLEVEGGLISNSQVGIQTTGSRVDASQVSIQTKSLKVKTSALPNSLGLVAPPSALPPACPPTCSGHGNCTGINICTCQNGYHEDDCSVQICGDDFCTSNETPNLCPADCLVIQDSTIITLQFGGMIPTPSCCSSSSRRR